MKSKTLLATAGICAIAAAASFSTASATSGKSEAVPADAVLTWNAYAVDAVRASSPPKLQHEGMIYMAYVQAAVYDAVTKVAGRYAPYHDFAATVAPDASPEAAVAAAARKTIENYLPDQISSIEDKYAAYIATLGGNVAAGVSVGEAAADDLISLRAGDGRNAATRDYSGTWPLIPGQWQTATPAATPWMASMRPFLLEGPSQFRAPPPPALDSKAYAKDFNEVKAYGYRFSSVRTPEQTATAYFWNAHVVSQFNKAMANATVQHGLDLVDAARLFAMVGLTMTHAGIACFDSKFFYLAWRPIAAIRNADQDGNPDTTAQPGWEPLLTTPGHPEYPSQHGCFTSAFADALSAALGEKRLDVTIPGAENGAITLTTERVYRDAKQMKHDSIDARVWIGFHWRNTVEQGVRLGEQVAGWATKRSFQPVH